MTKEPTPKLAHNTDSYTPEAEEKGDGDGRETAYRRGYFQGYHAALLDADLHIVAEYEHRMVLGSVTIPTEVACLMDLFLHGQLYPWRCAAHAGVLSAPPTDNITTHDHEVDQVEYLLARRDKLANMQERRNP